MGRHLGSGHIGDSIFTPIQFALGKSKKSRGTKTKLNKFGRAVIIDRAARDIGAKFAGKSKGKSLFLAGKAVGSAGVLFTGKELIRAKKRATKLRR